MADLERGMHPADWDDPATAARLGRGPERSRSAPRTSTSARASGAGCRPPRSAAGHRGPRSSSTPRSAPAATRSSTCCRREASPPTGSCSPTSTATRTRSCTPSSPRAGVTLEYDTIGRTKYRPDSVVLDLDRGRGPARATATGSCSGLDLGRARLLPRLRRRARPALPDDDVRASAAAPARRAGDRRASSSPTRRAPSRRAARQRRSQPTAADRPTATTSSSSGPGSAGSSAADQRGPGRRADAARRPARVHGRHLDRRARHVLRVLHAGRDPAARRRRPGLGGGERLTAEGCAFERPNTYGAGTGVTYDPEALKVPVGARSPPTRAWTCCSTPGRPACASTDGRVSAVRLWNKGGERWVGGGRRSSTRPATRTWRDGGRRLRRRGDDRPRSSRCRRCSGSPTWTSTARRPSRRPSCGRSCARPPRRGAYALPRLEGSWHRTPYPGVVDGPHDAHPERGRDRPGGADASRGRGSPPGARVPPLPARPRARLRGGRDRRHAARDRRAREPARDRRLPADAATTCSAGRRFDDEIALCGAPIEDHGPGGDTDWQYVADGARLRHPLSRAAPAGLDGLLVAGRCFSATHDAHASARSMATCMAMGQAAGTAAALAADARRVARGPSTRGPPGAAPGGRGAARAGRGRGGGPMSGTRRFAGRACLVTGSTGMAASAARAIAAEGGGGVPRLADRRARRRRSRRRSLRAGARRAGSGPTSRSRRRSRRPSPPAMPRSAGSTPSTTWPGSAAAASATGRSTRRPLDGWEAVMAANATSQFLVCRAAIRRMLAQAPDANGERGAVVTMSSALATRPVAALLRDPRVRREQGRDRVASRAPSRRTTRPAASAST